MTPHTGSGHWLADGPSRPDALAEEEALLDLRRRLWGLAYRLTGSAADADDVAQETLARGLAQAQTAGPPAAPWSFRVATHLAIDALRARRRRAYVGTWLPEALEDGDIAARDASADSMASPEARYGLAESATLAFLVALEALGPRQRAVLLLRDVFGYAAAEVADLIDTTEGNVRVLHLRGRRTLAGYDRARCRPTAELRARHQAALATLLRALQAQDGATLGPLLADTVRTVTDGGSAYTALRAPLDGRAAVVRFYTRAALNRAGGGPSIAVTSVNGLPAALITLARPVRRQAPATLMTLHLDAEGRVGAIYTLLAPPKLGALSAQGGRVPLGTV